MQNKHLELYSTNTKNMIKSNSKNNSTNQLNFITSEQLSALINTPVYTIRKLVRENKLPAYKITGKNFLFDYNEVIEAIKQCRVKV